MMKIIIVIGWAIVGIVNLCHKDEISKLSYLCVWILAMAGMIYRLLM